MRFIRPKAISAAAHLFVAGVSTRAGAYPLPRMAHIYLDIGEHRDRWPPLDLESWLLVFRRLSRLDVVKILGQDPFGRPDLTALIRGIRESIQPAILQLNTSIEHPEETCRVVSSIGWPGLHLRVAVQDWPLPERSIEALIRLNHIRRQRGFQLGLNVHVDSKCRDELAQIQSWCAKHEVGFFPGIPIQPVLFRETPETLKHYLIDRADIEAVAASKSSSRASGYSRAIRYLLSRANQQFLQGLAEDGPCQRFSCQEVSALAYILPNGTIVSCGLRTEPVGDLTQQTLAEIWSSPSAQEARSSIHSCPGCFQSSIQILSQLYSGNWTQLLSGKSR